MKPAPLRFVSAALWPLTIWTTLNKLDDHPVDDYVERTSPIVGTSIAFWICVGVLITLAVVDAGMFATVLSDDAPQRVHYVRASYGIARDVLWFFTPVLYVAGFWMFTSRAEAYPR